MYRIIKSICLIITPFLFLFFISLSGFSQSSGLPYNHEVSLSTPYESVVTHLYFLQPEQYDIAKAIKPFMHAETDSARARKMAIQLKQAWDGRGLPINMATLPRDPEYVDSLTQRNIYVPISQTPNIYLEKQQDGRWLYSKESFNAIDKFHSEVYPYGAERLMELIPKSSHFKFFGLYLWQHLGILIIIVLAFLLHKLLTWIFDLLLYKGAHHLGYDKVVRPYLSPVARPLSLFVVFLMVLVLFPLLQIPPEASFYINYAFRAILPFFVMLVFYRLINVLSLYLERVAEKSDTSLDNNVVPLIRKILKVFVIIIGGLFILQNLNVNITALLAGLSIGGLAVALAAQDTLKNMFGSFMIFVDKPFSVGHWITTQDLDGTVEEVGFRSTRIRTFRNSLTYVPNGKLADSTIDNHGLRQYRRFNMQIAITYDTPPNLIEVFIEGLRRIVEEHPHTRKDFYMVEFNEMGDFSLKILFYVFFAVPTWPEELRARNEILLKILRLAEKLGVRFAFPTQTLHMETFPDKGSLTPNYDMKMEDFKKEMEDFFSAKKNN